MRNFATDAPVFFTFTLGTSKKVHKLPTPASMPYKDVLRLAEIGTIQDENLGNYKAMELQHELLQKYMGDAADELTAAQVAEIFGAWMASSEEEGVDAGE